ncbi:arylesterase [Desulfococcaceae bacterium OttesenSCG-928-F15]|nr:arylesterase [Desulfococcaceae bacterium OttesenSCG-928-F15]
MKKYWLFGLFSFFLLWTACDRDSGGGSWNTMNPGKDFTIVALGDSLTEGWGVDPEDAYPVLLEEGLRKKGWPVRVINAGISGETSSGTLSRVGRVIERHKPQLVILAIGANDGLNRMSVASMEENIRKILTKLEESGIPVLFCGMKLFFNLGPGYTRDFEEAYAKLAEEKNLQFIPFFLKGVALKPSLNLSDGVHPNGAGYEEIVRRILPEVERALKKEGVKPIS